MPWWRSEDTTIPSLVHTSMSMCGYTLRWLIRRRFGSRSRSSTRLLRALPDQHEGLGVVEAVDQLFDVLHVVRPHRDVVVRELRRSDTERPERVEVVVEDQDLHRAALPHPGDELDLDGDPERERRHCRRRAACAGRGRRRSRRRVGASVDDRGRLVCRGGATCSRPRATSTHRRPRSRRSGRTARCSACMTEADDAAAGERARSRSSTTTSRPWKTTAAAVPRQRSRSRTSSPPSRGDAEGTTQTAFYNGRSSGSTRSWWAPRHGHGVGRLLARAALPPARVGGRGRGRARVHAGQQAPKIARHHRLLDRGGDHVHAGDRRELRPPVHRQHPGERPALARLLASPTTP